MLSIPFIQLLIKAQPVQCLRGKIDGVTAISTLQSALGIYLCKQPFGHRELPLRAAVLDDVTANKRV